ncbi:hypothetical protein [Streptomyces sp. WMMB 322]|uniref:hypothetical protein n=1 Tax=Streptomyces sp. WMMB 322 TaxID=1286821 RepID=UPI0008237916|nr:hypothetical protein [Streptomyces sp. WMMB 322]SCK50258.1 hypothetical protein H180DRAFT_04535 [Streptomyces sp. WMMB 322]
MRDDERGEPDQRTSLVPVPAKSRQRPRLPWPRKGGGDAGDDAEQRGKVRAFLGLVADRVIDVAPRIPVRDLETLRKQFPGLGPEEIADKLVAGAARSSATVGAGVGAAAMLPVPPAMPAELAAEIVGVASVELKLIAELHEVYGHRLPGNVKQRAAACIGAWTSERGIDITRPTTFNAALGGQMKRELRQQLLKRTVRNLPNLTPFMVGAAVGAVMNSRDTRKIAEKIRADLRAAGNGWEALPPGAGEDPDGLGPGGWTALPPSPR